MRRIALVLVLAAACGSSPRVRSAKELGAVDRALVARLASPSAGERSQASFTLGQLGIAWTPAPLAQQVEAEALLVDRLAREQDPAVREAIVAALGRVGRSRGREVLLTELRQPGPTAARAGLALSHLYHRLREHELDPTGDVPALQAALATSDPAVRRGVVAALADADRAAARATLVRELDDPDEVCRAFAASGLARQAQPDDVPRLEKALRDPDERVAAFAALAIARVADEGLAPQVALDALGRALDVVATHPAVVVALADEALQAPGFAPFFADLASRTPEAHVACLARLAHDRILGKPELVEACPAERGRLVARLYAEALPSRVKDLGPLLALSQGDEHARAGAAAALGRYDDPRANARLLDLCADSRPAVWSAAAESANQAKLKEAGPVLLRHVPRTLQAEELDGLPSLLEAIAVLAPPGAADLVRPLTRDTPSAIARAASAALEKLGHREKPQPAPPHLPYDDVAIRHWPDAAVVRLETTRGVVRIALHDDVAPHAARNFAGLARRGFFDGSPWHRVVPGFVAQGGDPRGDGTGGAGYLLPCEPNGLPYEEGTVGMALSGLDTGSSQFFVALLPEPHLEGRYTAFGKVVDGMATVRALLPDDKILRATVEGAP